MGTAKIAFVIESLENRGAQNLMVQWAIRLQEKGFRVHIVTFRDERSPLIQKVQQAGLPLKMFHKRQRVDMHFFRKLVSYFKEENFDIVHTHVFTANLWGQLAAGISRTPVRILHEHGYFSLASGFRRNVTRGLMKMCSKILVVSDHLKQSFRTDGKIPAAKVEVIKNGVDWEDFDRTIVSEPLRNGQLVVGAVSALEPRKDPFNFVHAAEEILRSQNNIEFWWVGDGLLFPEVQEYVSRKKLSQRIKLWGNQKQVRSFLEQMDVFVLPSKTEGVPLSLLEAMGAGVPVVATRVGENEGIVSSGENGFLVPAENPKALGEAILRLVNSEEVREKFGKNAKAFVRTRFSLVESTRQLTQLYTELLR
ncbi:alpha-D-kanosaminyltransferase [bacterium BMS3Abin05]|nr:alpha-D-kanosaminyltransferase [bacterium BMS3Abin05]GBE27674.1 alpha-D-kanosaminyltransferase [bacterium BMS3Bbin03]HDZ13057.1 glycosyltransferase family 1 protein [Bacteroidota bacterium]